MAVTKGRLHRSLQRRLCLALPIVFAILLVWGYWEDFRADGPIHGASAICEECGVEPSELDWLVETMRDRMATGMNRAELLEAFYATFDEPAEGEASPCRACAEAVLDVANGF